MLTQENIDAINSFLADLAEGKTQTEIGVGLGFGGLQKPAHPVSAGLVLLRSLGVARTNGGRGAHLKAVFCELEELRAYKAAREAEQTQVRAAA